MTLMRQNAAWASSHGVPFRCIAALVVFGDGWKAGREGVARVTGSTDKRGNAAVLTKLMSSKFPLVVILSEVAAQLRQRGMDLQLNWVPREENDAADALTNHDFGVMVPALH